MEHAMRPIVLAARVELLILSDLTATPETAYTEDDVRFGLLRVVWQHGGVHAAIADAAGELGDHPETWYARYAWAMALIDDVYSEAPHRTVRSSACDRVTVSV
jgi:hypothetical protein